MCVFAARKQRTNLAKVAKQNSLIMRMTAVPNPYISILECCCSSETLCIAMGIYDHLTYYL